MGLLGLMNLEAPENIPVLVVADCLANVPGRSLLWNTNVYTVAAELTKYERSAICDLLYVRTDSVELFVASSFAFVGGIMSSRNRLTAVYQQLTAGQT